MKFAVPTFIKKIATKTIAQISPLRKIIQILNNILGLRINTQKIKSFSFASNLSGQVGIAGQPMKIAFDIKEALHELMVKTNKMPFSNLYSFSQFCKYFRTAWFLLIAESHAIVFNMSHYFSVTTFSLITNRNFL